MIEEKIEMSTGIKLQNIQIGLEAKGLERSNPYS